MCRGEYCRRCGGCACNGFCGLCESCEEAIREEHGEDCDLTDFD